MKYTIYLTDEKNGNIVGTTDDIEMALFMIDSDWRHMCRNDQNHYRNSGYYTIEYDNDIIDMVWCKTI